MSGASPPRPPRLARWLLTWLLPEEYREAVLGDLAEAFDQRCSDRRIVAFARAWYWKQVFHVDVLRLRGEARAERAQGMGGRVMRDVFTTELRQALRVFWRSPGFVAAVLLTLSLGIGGGTSIFSLVNGLLLRPVPGVQDQDRLVALRTGARGSIPAVSSYMNFLDFRERNTTFEHLAAFKPRQVDASISGTSEPLGATMVTASYFDVLGVQARLGRFFTPDADEGIGAHPEAILTDGLWRRWFGGDPDVLGKSMVINGLAYTVIGVTPPGFTGTSMADVPDVFVPISMQLNLMPSSGFLLDRRGWGGISIIGKLAEGVSISAAAADVEIIGAQLVAEYPRFHSDDTEFKVLGFREASLPGDARTPIVQLSVLLLAIVAALWLVVCLNVANLFLARSMKRRQELSVRIALGASRLRVTGQLVLEFMIIALAAGVAGVLLSRTIAQGIAALPIPFTFAVTLDLPTLLFAAGVAVMSGLLCAVVPALALSGTDPRVAVSPATSMRPARRRWPSRVMIVGQITLSVMLLSTTGLFVQTFANLSSYDMGFDSENLLTAEFNPELQGYDGTQVSDFYQRLTEAALRLPGVVALTMADALPAAQNFGRDNWFLEGATDREQPSLLALTTVGENYFPTMGIPITDGRGFDEGDRPGEPMALVINRSAAKLVESRTGRAPVGQRIGLFGAEGPFLEIVGVVGDSRTGRESQAPPHVYGVRAQVAGLGFGGSRMVVMLKTSVPPGTLASAFRQAAAGVDPNVSAGSLITMDRFLADLLVVDRLTVTVLSVSSLLALLLVAIGVYGLLAYVVTLRTREFGVRLALGARTANLQSIVVREAIALAVAGLALGVVGALATTRLTSNFLVGVTAVDPVSMAAGITIVIAVTSAAAYVPARRATRADPVVAMRAE